MSEPINLTFNDIEVLRNCLQMLDGYEETVEVSDPNSPTGKTERTVKKPYSFSGDFRWAIIKNLKKFNAELEDLEKARIELVKQYAGGGEKVPDADVPAFIRDYSTLRNRVQAVEGLTKFSKADLDLNKNKLILTSVVMALEPLISDSLV